jgi:tRNA-2-methylthio-N6-dimethylallyladenosine synthase
MKYHLITYGCQMNTADSEEMAQPLKDKGFLATADPEQADVILMNTCTVREQAEHRAQSNLGRLREWKEADPKRLLIVAGCAASRWGESIKKRYPFIDLVSPATKIDHFPELVNAAMKDRWNFDLESQDAFEAPAMAMREAHVYESGNLFGDAKTAYVTIMRGCNYSCSYCIVPQVRGRESYRPMNEIVSEVRNKVDDGFKEVMLLGQTVNSYYDRPALGPSVLDFSDLLRAVDAVEGLERIRFMSPHPKHMKDHVIQAMAECDKVCRHLHLPLQSGSDRLLAAMKRLYTREQYAHIVAKLRAAMPGILVTTDIIVGYPGETEIDHRETLGFLESLQLDGLFAFKYSPRPGTVSAEAPDDVSTPVKDERLQDVLALSKRISGGKAAWAN